MSMANREDVVTMESEDKLDLMEVVALRASGNDVSAAERRKLDAFESEGRKRHEEEQVPQAGGTNKRMTDRGDNDTPPAGKEPFVRISDLVEAAELVADTEEAKEQEAPPTTTTNLKTPAKNRVVSSARDGTTAGAYRYLSSRGVYTRNEEIRYNDALATDEAINTQVAATSDPELGRQQATKSTNNPPTRASDATALEARVSAAPTVSTHNPADPLEAPAVAAATTDTNPTSANANDDTTKPNRTVTYAAVGGSLLVIAIIVILCATLIPGGDSSDNDQEGGDAAVATDSALGAFTEESIKAMFPESTIQAMERPFSAQTEAFKWLMDDPHLAKGLYSKDRMLQRMALATFYFALGGRRWENSTGWLDYEISECEWYSGLMDEYNDTTACDDNYWSDQLINVVQEDTTKTDDSFVFKHLYLPGNNLKGELPLEFYWLTNLWTIQLSRNDIGGTVVGTEIAKLTSLGQIVMISNQLEGGIIPSELATLTNLTWIGFSDNRGLEGIPEEIWTLTNLEGLELDLGSSIPLGSLGELSQLYWLVLNDLTGTIPSELGLLTGLERLRLEAGRLRGTIPTTLAQLSDLEGLYLERNSLTGMLPTELGLVANLTWLDLSENRITGGIPTEWVMNSALQTLRVAGNRLTQPLPTELGLMTGLNSLSLSRNKLQSAIPTELGAVDELEDLYLVDCELMGPIPSELGVLSALEELDLGSNSMLNGTIPTEVGNLANLTEFYLDECSLSGVFPTELGNLHNLTSLSCNDNSMSGSIPSEFGQLEALYRLEVKDNLLTGTVPVELEDLFVRNNSLGVLSLDGNNFTGSIPEQLCSVNKTEIDCTENFCGCDCACT